jgi:hypothetical protein
MKIVGAVLCALASICGWNYPPAYSHWLFLIAAIFLLGVAIRDHISGQPIDAEKKMTRIGGDE